MCQLTISGVAARDHGAWTCVISDNLSLDTTKRVVRVGVAVGGHLQLRPGGGAVQLGEGDTAQLVCRYILELQTKVREDFTNMKMAPTKAFSWLKVPTIAFAHYY